MPTKSEIIEKLASEIKTITYVHPNNKRAMLKDKLCKKIATACFNALSEYVTFLEEGSEPIEGDLVDGLRIGHVMEFEEGDCEPDEILVDVHGGTWEMKKNRVQIIQRANKPVITLQKE